MGWQAQDGEKPLRNAGLESKVQFRHRGRYKKATTRG